MVQMLSSYVILSFPLWLMTNPIDVIHVSTNNILNHANYEDTASSIINIGLDCKNNGVNKV